MKKIGPSFAYEMTQAGLNGLPVAWNEGDEGALFFGDDITEQQRAAVLAVLDAHDPTKPAPQIVPSQVTASQGGIALIYFGLMDAVQAVVDAPDTPATHKWAWARATTWERDSPSFNYFADRAGITEQQKDELFVFAGAVVP